MDRRNVLSLSAITALGLALLSDNALGQQAADVEGVKAASKAFYAALAVIDNGEAKVKPLPDFSVIAASAARDGKL